MRRAHGTVVTVDPVSPPLCAHLDGSSRPLPPALSASAESAPYRPPAPTAVRTRSPRSPSAPATAPRLADRPRREGHALCVEPAQPTGDGHAFERRARQSAVILDSGQRHQLSLTVAGTPRLVVSPHRPSLTQVVASEKHVGTQCRHATLSLAPGDARPQLMDDTLGVTVVGGPHDRWRLVRIGSFDWTVSASHARRRLANAQELVTDVEVVYAAAVASAPSPSLGVGPVPTLFAAPPRPCVGAPPSRRAHTRSRRR